MENSNLEPTQEISQDHWSVNSCAWCSSTASEFIFEGPDRLGHMPGKFQMVRCKKCGLIRQNPRLVWDRLKDYYPDDYVAYDWGADQEKKSIFQSWINGYGNWKRRRAIESYIVGGTLLEVGCGTGAFLRELLGTNRWEVIGIEPNASAVAYARKSLKSKIYEGRFSEIPLREESLDVVVMFCVLEHLENPIEDLKKANKLMKLGGYLVFTIPNPESLGNFVFGKYWAGWDLPRHLYIFPHDVLNEILIESGFQIISRQCLATSYHALGHSLEFWTQSWETKYPRLKRLLIYIYYWRVVRIALAVPLSIIDRINLCTNITYFVQKTGSPKK